MFRNEEVGESEAVFVEGEKNSPPATRFKRGLPTTVSRERTSSVRQRAEGPPKPSAKKSLAFGTSGSSLTKSASLDKSLSDLVLTS